MESTSTVRLLSLSVGPELGSNSECLRAPLSFTNGQRENGSSAGVALGRSGIRAVFNTIAIRV